MLSKLFKNNTNINSFSLVEILVAIAVFTIVIGGLGLVYLDTIRIPETTQYKLDALMSLDQELDLLNQYKANHWENILNANLDTPYSFIISGNQIVIQPSTKTVDGITLWFELSSANRDVSGNIDDLASNPDRYTRKVTFFAQWDDTYGIHQSMHDFSYINDWNTPRWQSTLTSDFGAGTFDSTKTVENGDGEVELSSIYFPDWCSPQENVTGYDIPGTATVKSVFAQVGNAYLGTRGSTSGNPFTKLNLSGVSPVNVAVEGTFNGYNVNEIYVDGNYAFLATTDNSKEVVILDVSSYPYTEVGYVNTSGSSDARSVIVDGNYGYVAAGRYIYVFDLSSYTGHRNVVESVRVSGWFGTVSQIQKVNNYLYAVLDWDWYELAIISASNPTNLSITSKTSVNNQQVYDMYVSNDGNRVYFGTNESSYEDELFILDTTNKNSTSSVIASFDTGGTTVRGIAVIPEDNILIYVGTGGEEYTVLDITNETNPTRCGGFNVNSGIYDIDSLNDLDNNAFSYIITGDSNSEFKILRGGQGIGGVSGYGYPSFGTYTSEIFDTTYANAGLSILSWDELLPVGSDIRFQLRSSDNSNMAGSVWIGPDGTSSTYYTDHLGSLVNAATNGGRYIQYKAFLTGDTTSTPSLELVDLYYYGN